MTPSARAATRLLQEKDSIAHEITEAMYAARPELLARYGPVGRERCLEDLHFTIEHLIPAVDLEQPAMFAGYVRWLDELLRSRNVSTEDVVQSLETTERVVARRLPPEEAVAVAAVVRAGLAVLGAGRDA